MTPYEAISKRLHDGMTEHEMHACLRDTGRYAGGLAATGAIKASDLIGLEALAARLSLNSEEGRTKWREAVAYGRNEPVEWDSRIATGGPSRVLDWNSAIDSDGDYEIFDPSWTEPVPVEEPESWNPSEQIITYLQTLFQSEEHVGYVVDAWMREGRKPEPKRGFYDRTAGELIGELVHYDGNLSLALGSYNPAVGAWIRFNPLDGKGVCDKNVTHLRYTLVESDDLDIDKQRGVYERLELPIAALVHSGNKSLHAIVRIDAPDMTEYKRRVDLVYKVCEKNGLTGLDNANRNPSRLSRMPGVERNGQRQFLVATNLGKKSWEEWEDWIEAVNDDLPDPETLEPNRDQLPELASPLIEGVLRQGHKMLVAGPSKAGKSYQLIQLCAAIAEGSHWLGWKCEKGRVLYVNLELDRASCLHRFHDVYEAMGLRPNASGNLDIWNLRGRAVPMDRLAPKLIRRAAKKGYMAVVIDPIYKVITGDENAADKMAHFCNQFDLVCHELKAAVIYCHHHSKGLQGSKRSMDRASGSGVFARDPDAMLDLIELPIDDAMRTRLENDAICTMLRTELRELLGSEWDGRLDDPDDAFNEEKLRAFASRSLGDDYRRDLLPRVYACRQKVQRMSAWRIEGTLREFARRPPVDCWFDHPVHRIDTEDLLKDVTPEADRAPWEKGRDTNASRSKKRKEKRQADLLEAYDTLYGFDPGVPVTVKALVDYFGKTEQTIRNWVGESPHLKCCHGTVARVEES
jgi:RecA-family ATPase